MDTLEIKNLHAEIDGKKIIKGLNLTLRSGEIHAIMGPNGSGKSTLCYVLMKHPRYEVTKGSIKFNGKSIADLDVTERARLGLFLGFQHPTEVSGVTFSNFLRLAKNANLQAGHARPVKNAAASGKEKHIRPTEFAKTLKEKVDLLKMKEDFVHRYVNTGFSGGERKRAEIVQMSILEPKIALLDEIDSGLDIDALKTVATGIRKIFEKNKCGVLLITHYQRILNHIRPHHVHIMHDGKIIKSGGEKLAQELEKNGYEKYIK